VLTAGKEGLGRWTPRFRRGAEHVVHSGTNREGYREQEDHHVRAEDYWPGWQVRPPPPDGLAKESAADAERQDVLWAQLFRPHS
jgi:hypothetical protein